MSSVCPSFYLSIFLSAEKCPNICPSVCLYIFLFFWKMSKHLFICLPSHLSVCWKMSKHLSVCLSNHVRKYVRKFELTFTTTTLDLTGGQAKAGVAGQFASSMNMNTYFWTFLKLPIQSLSPCTPNKVNKKWAST